MSFSLNDEQHKARLAQLIPELETAIRSDDTNGLAEMLLAVWTGVEFPEEVLDRQTWLKAFRRTQPHFLRRNWGTDWFAFRGCPARRKAGMSWTIVEDKARWFAERCLQPTTYDSRRGGYVSTAEPIAFLYYANVHETALLCDVDANPTGEGRRGEGEVILDPAELEIIERASVKVWGPPAPAGVVRVRWSG